MKTITKYAKEKCRKYNKEVDFHTTTNATLLDEEKISFIVKHDITVMVSIDGPEDLHDKQRPFSNGKGSYHLVEYNCKKLISAVPDIIAHAVILGDTDPIMVKDYLLNFGFCGITLTPASNSLFSNEKNLRQVTRYAKLMRADIEGEADNWIIFVQKKDKKNVTQKEILTPAGAKKVKFRRGAASYKR